MKRRHYLVDDSIYPVFVTTTITKWVPVFSDRKLAESSLIHLEEIRARLGATFFGYVLMPNHFHGILKTSVKGDLSKIMKQWKGVSSKSIIDFGIANSEEWLKIFHRASIEFHRDSKINYQVWQPRFDEYAFRDKYQFETKLNYIHGNPMKHHLVENAEDYPYSSIHDYLGRKNGYLTVETMRT
jgi:putative transposase